MCMSFFLYVCVRFRMFKSINFSTPLPPNHHLYPQETQFFARVIYDLLFFFIVIIITLNLIFGVIIDTFADLRSEKQQKEEILKNTCFICGGSVCLCVFVPFCASTNTHNVLLTPHRPTFNPTTGLTTHDHTLTPSHFPPNFSNHHPQPHPNTTPLAQAWKGPPSIIKRFLSKNTARKNTIYGTISTSSS